MSVFYQNLLNWLESAWNLWKLTKIEKNKFLWREKWSFWDQKIKLKAYSNIFKYFFKKCEEIKNQVQKTFPREKSPCDEIKTRGGILQDFFHWTSSTNIDYHG